MGKYFILAVMSVLLCACNNGGGHGGDSYNSNIKSDNALNGSTNIGAPSQDSPSNDTPSQEETTPEDKNEQINPLPQQPTLEEPLPEIPVVTDPLDKLQSMDFYTAKLHSVEIDENDTYIGIAPEYRTFPGHYDAETKELTIRHIYRTPSFIGGHVIRKTDATWNTSMMSGM